MVLDIVYKVIASHVHILSLIQSPIPLPDMTHIKVLLIGNSGVGKTSLIQRYLRGVYDDSPATVSLIFSNLAS